MFDRCFVIPRGSPRTIHTTAATPRETVISVHIPDEATAEKAAHACQVSIYGPKCASRACELLGRNIFANFHREPQPKPPQRHQPVVYRGTLSQVHPIGSHCRLLDRLHLACPPASICNAVAWEVGGPCDASDEMGAGFWALGLAPETFYPKPCLGRINAVSDWQNVAPRTVIRIALRLAERRCGETADDVRILRTISA